MRSVGTLLLALVAAVAAADEPLRRIGDDRFRFTGEILASTLSPDGRRLAVLSKSPARRQAIVTIFDTATRKQIFLGRAPVESQEPHPFPGLAISPDGRFVAATIDPSTAFVLEIATGREVWREKQSRKGRFDICRFDAVGRLIRPTTSGFELLNLATGAVDAVGSIGGGAILSPDGKSFVRENAPGSDLELGDSATGQVRKRLPLKTDHTDDARGLAFSHDGRTLAVVHNLSEIHLIDAATGQTRRTWKLVEHTLPKLNAEYAIAFSQDDQALVLSTTGEILSWDLEPYRQRKSLMQGQSEFVRTWQHVDEGRTLLLPRNGLVERWTTATGERIPEEQNGCGEAFALTPDGSQLLIGDTFGNVSLWSAETGRFVRNLPIGPGRKQAVRSLAVSPDGRFFALYRAADGDLEVHPLNPIAGKPNPLGSQASSRSYLIAWSPKSRHVYGYQSRNYVREFVRYDAVERRIDASLAIKEPLTATPDGREWIFGSATSRVDQDRIVNENEFHRFEIGTRKELGKLALQERPFPQANRLLGRYSPDGSILAVAGDSQIELLGAKLPIIQATDFVETRTNNLLVDSRSDVKEVRALAFTPNGHWLVSGDEEGAVRIWETGSGKLVRRIDGHDRIVSQVAVSPDGRMVYSGGRDGFVYQWDLKPRSAKPGATVEELWKTAANADPSVAVPAAWALIENESMRKAVWERLKPVTIPDGTNVKRWLANLDAPAFADRKAATRALEELSRTVEAELRETLATTPSAEVRERVEALLKRIERKYSPEELRAMRLVHACEWHRAKELLEAWAAGAPSAVLTREADAALARRK